MYLCFIISNLDLNPIKIKFFYHVKRFKIKGCRLYGKRDDKEMKRGSELGGKDGLKIVKTHGEIHVIGSTHCLNLGKRHPHANSV